MTRRELNDAYFKWLYQLVRTDDRYSGRVSHHKLLLYLHSVDFTYIIPMDGNRAEDGINLRYRFGDEYSYDDAVIASCLDDRPCSVLEMMVALAIRCEENIMTDPDIGDRTGRWFWGMIDNLRLTAMNDLRFNERYVNTVVTRLLERDYGRNGEGGLFTVYSSSRDMRHVDIWYQMCGYLREIV